MSTEKTEAIVVRQTDFSETSRIVTLFTRDWGQISVIAKGARRLKGPFEAALDLLTVCRIVFIRKSSSGLDILTEAQLLKRFKPSDHNLDSLYGGYYVAELLSSLTAEYDPHPILYDEAVRTLDNLSHEAHPQKSVLKFELVVLREIGHLPALDVCIACGNPLVRGPLAFWVSQGGLLCPGCQQEAYGHNRIPLGTVVLLRRLAVESSSASDRLEISPQQYRELRQFMTSAISHILGRRPKMTRYLTSPKPKKK